MSRSGYQPQGVVRTPQSTSILLALARSVDTAQLVATHRGKIQLSPINSGATLYNPQPRGHDTFSSIADYPFDERQKTRTAMASVAELVVIDGVPDIKDHLIAVHTVDNGVATELWRRPGTGDDDGP
jgi:hypothetical protein